MIPDYTHVLNESTEIGPDNKTYHAHTFECVRNGEKYYITSSSANSLEDSKRIGEAFIAETDKDNSWESQRKAIQDGN